jgi:hypothetical protein
MYVNLYDNVVIMEYVQENGTCIMLSHPMMYVTFTLKMEWTTIITKKADFLWVFL